MARRKKVLDEQGMLFGEVQMRTLAIKPRRKTTPAAAAPAAPAAVAKPVAAKTWTMPPTSGSTVAEVRLRWNKRLTPAQVARVEGELALLPRLLGNLGFGEVRVEHCFVRRRQKG